MEATLPPGVRAKKVFNEKMPLDCYCTIDEDAERQKDAVVACCDIENLLTLFQMIIIIFTWTKAGSTVVSYQNESFSSK